MPIRLALPQSSSTLSMTNPTPSLAEVLNVSSVANSTFFNTFVYSPYDFSQATAYDYFLAPLLDGMDVIAPMICVFFAAQYFGWYLLRFMFPARFKSLEVKEQRDLSIRVVAVVNGLVCFRSALAFYTITSEHGNNLHNFHFQVEDDKYRFSRLSIVAYFAWDLIVCVYYRWGALWVAHAVASLIGVFGMASIPLSDHLGGYYSGVFELTNGLIHVAFLFRSMDTCLTLATVLEGLFAALYTFIRVIGGTYVTGRWLYDMLAFYQTTGCANIGVASTDTASLPTGYALQRIAAGYFGLLPEIDGMSDGIIDGAAAATVGDVINPCPPAAFLITMCVLLSVVQVLQYIWFVQIVRVALGIGERAEPVTPKTKAGEASFTSKDETAKITKSAAKKAKAAGGGESGAGNAAKATDSSSTGGVEHSKVVKPLHHTNGVDVVGNVPDAHEAVDVTSAYIHDHMPHLPK